MAHDPAHAATKADWMHERHLRRLWGNQQHLTPTMLDALADGELHLGHHRAAEQLARRAAAMREARP